MKEKLTAIWVTKSERDKIKSKAAKEGKSIREFVVSKTIKKI